jgi:hypothetical protein
MVVLDVGWTLVDRHGDGVEEEQTNNNKQGTTNSFVPAAAASTAENMPRRPHLSPSPPAADLSIQLAMHASEHNGWKEKLCRPLHSLTFFD